MATLQTRLSELITALGTDYKNIQIALGLKAPLASPALTGNPTAPTQTPGTNNTRIATTAYVDAAINGGAPVYLLDAGQTVAAYQTAHGVTIPAGSIIARKA